MSGFISEVIGYEWLSSQIIQRSEKRKFFIPVMGHLLPPCQGRKWDVGRVDKLKKS